MAGNSSSEKDKEIVLKDKENKTLIWGKVIGGLTKIGGSIISLFN